MQLRDTFQLAFKSALANRNRSLLTMLGVIIGVGSVVLMTAVGESMEGVILGQISSIGAKSMVVFPGYQEGPAGAIQAGYDSLTFSDVEALEKLTTVKNIGPAIIAQVDKAYYEGEETEIRLIGTIPNYFLNREVTIATGRLIDENDVSAARSVTVLGSEVADELFKGEDPIGQRVKMGTRTYTVIGVLEPIGTQFFQNADEFVFIPLSTARAINSQKFFNIITMQTTGDFDLAIADVKYLLRTRHGIANPDDDDKKDDFMVRTSAQANEILGTVSLGLTFFITTIASISLIVGGIGIMNIMLVAVTERTREIGLRKAVGAKKRDILLQFLIEAVVLTVLAGIIGVIGGLVIAWLISLVVYEFLNTYLFAVSGTAVVIAMFMAVVTGLGFGVYPAKKASELSPMSALRYE